MDEMFESLTLIQTKRMKPIPFLLFGRDWWETVINWNHLAEAGVISPEDLTLMPCALPLASISVVAVAPARSPTEATRSPRMPTSARRPGVPEPSKSVPLRTMRS